MFSWFISTLRVDFSERNGRIKNSRDSKNIFRNSLKILKRKERKSVDSETEKIFC